MWWHWLSQNVQCHSLAIGNKKRCDETDFHKTCNVTHKLLVMWRGVRRVPFKKCPMSHSLLVIGKDVMRPPVGTKHAISLTSCGHGKGCDDTDFHKCAISLTSYLSKEKVCISRNVPCHSLPVCHRKWCDKTTFHKICNVTHFLLVIGKDVMTPPFTKFQCHSLAVGHRNRCDDTNKICNVTHFL